MQELKQPIVIPEYAKFWHVRGCMIDTLSVYLERFICATSKNCVHNSKPSKGDVKDYAMAN